MLKNSFRSVPQLLRYLAIEERSLPSVVDLQSPFAFLTTQFYADLIEKGNAEDPLLRQILPLQQERVATPHFTVDPLQEFGNDSGVIQKYDNRLLLMTSGHCAINCRYCFRRHFNYSEQGLSRQQWREQLEKYLSTKLYREVILSGGDPLVLSNSQLRFFIDTIGSYKNVKFLRIHTRTPVVLPQRIDQELMEILASSAQSVALVFHINHPNEISAELRQVCRQLQKLGILLLNQAVLLAGVNDREQVLIELSEQLVTAKIIPYYIHLLDAVAGSHHFAVSDRRTQRLQQRMWQKLPGYMLPKFVREKPNSRGKIPQILQSTDKKFVF